MFSDGAEKFAAVFAVIIIVLAFITAFKTVKANDYKYELIEMSDKYSHYSSACNEYSNRAEQLENEYTSVIEEYDFYHSFAVICYDSDKRYHKFGCDCTNENESFYIYNIDNAKAQGYTKCSVCFDE